MATSARSSLTQDEWQTIRDFTERADGYTFPRYEAKLVEDLEKEFVERDVVLVREHTAFGSERLIQLPKEVVLEVAAGIDE